MKALDKTIEQIRDILVREYQPDKIILFGSRARGDSTPDSDVDILVVSDREKELPRYKRGLAVRLKLAAVRVPKDVLFYTHADFGKWRSVRQSFVSTVLREGVILYER